MVERQRRLLELQPIAAAFHRELSDDRERLELRYRPAGARIGEAPLELVVEQLKAAMREARDEEIGRGQTAVGPQRDDVEVWLDDHEARLYASQGQQRSAVLSLKLAELHYLAEVTGEQPVLLLDDVMSELDPARRERLLAALEPGPQALITAADLNDLPKSILERAAVFRSSRVGFMRSIGAALPKTLTALGITRRTREAQALWLWPQVVGEHLGRETKALKLTGRTLLATASSPAPAQQPPLERSRVNERLYQP